MKMSFSKFPFFALLAAALLVSFARNLSAPAFVSHEASILHLPLLSWWKDIPLVFSRDFLAFSEGQFRPLSYAILAAVRTFVGADRASFWHIWLLAFHWLNAVLLSFLVVRFTQRPAPAVFAGASFCLHPLASILVNDISYFHYVLGLSFYLGAWLSYSSFAGARGRRAYIASLVLFVLGTFTSKVVFTLPLVLAAYELLYLRSGPKEVLMRLLPFVGISLAISPLWWFYKPHPLYYKYIEFPPKAGWYSFFSVVGATGRCAEGLLLGLGFPSVLHEAVGRILNFPHPRFLVWGSVDVGVLLAGMWLLRRGTWAGLGVVIAFCSLLPFASTAWNGVEKYISWAYLYFPLAGFSVAFGGATDAVLSSPGRFVRIVGSAALCSIVLYYQVRQATVNLAYRSDVSYWRRALHLTPKGRIASLELGKAYLRLGMEDRALGLLFSPSVRQLRDPCLIMTRYYSDKGDYLAAAVHLRMTSGEEPGLQFQRSEMAGAELFYAAGALDYAESALGRVLMANPYNTAAMELLSEIWLLKGYVKAAGRLASWAERIAPEGPHTVRMRKKLKTYRSSAGAPPVIHPPKPSWLRYVVQGRRDPSLREAIVRLSESRGEDPVIQMEAGICLVMEGRPEDALRKFSFVTGTLPNFAYGWALRCWAAAKAGNLSQAEYAGERALELEPDSPTVHRVLGYLYSSTAGSPNYEERMEKAIRHYRLALGIEPNHAGTYNDLGNVLRRLGRLDEAIACYRKALKIRHDFAQAHNNLGIALAHKGRLDEAIAHYLEALELMPDFAEAYNNLGVALAEKGDMDGAIHNFRQALKVKSGLPGALYNLVMALIARGKFGEAVEVLRDRLTRRPDDIGAAMDLARILTICPDPKLRNVEEAVQLAEDVCRRTRYRDPRALVTLADAYAESDRLDEAVATAKLALRIATLSGEEDLRAKVEERLRRYFKLRRRGGR
ncbi:MAG TPA: tetratricopeptide repeat protein [Candidatus Latescibacteria bacterium]|nr:tetratricopeptide repeat protein [Candidatus Latescibacterota bacterium]